MHLSQLPSGRWRVAVKHRGLRRSATARTKSEARQRGADLIHELGGRPKARVTVCDLLDTHLAEVVLSPTTRADYESVRRRLPNTFTARMVRDVTPPIVAALYRQLERDGLSPHRIRRIHDLCRVAWRRAVAYLWAESNPFTVITPPTFDKPAIEPPTPEEVAALIAAAGDTTFATYLRVAASTGARRGELVALEWDDINFDKSTVRIVKSHAYTPASGVVVRPTKTGDKGHRTISVGLPVMSALRKLRAAQVELALAASVPARFVFSSTAGATAWHPCYPTTQFDRVSKRVGLDRYRLHDLRHFVATQMLASGESVPQVASRLGQTQMATTARYSHWLPSRDRDVADMLEALIQ